MRLHRLIPSALVAVVAAALHVGCVLLAQDITHLLKPGVRAESIRGSTRMVLTIDDGGRLSLRQQGLDLGAEGVFSFSSELELWSGLPPSPTWNVYGQMRWIRGSDGSLTVLVPVMGGTRYLQIWSFPSNGDGPRTPISSPVRKINMVEIVNALPEGDLATKNDLERVVYGLDLASAYLFEFDEKIYVIGAAHGARAGDTVYVAPLEELQPRAADLSRATNALATEIADGEDPRVTVLDGSLLLAMRRPAGAPRVGEHAPVAFFRSQDASEWTEDKSLASEGLQAGSRYEIISSHGELFLLNPAEDDERVVDILRFNKFMGRWDMIEQIRIRRLPGDKAMARVVGFGGPGRLTRPGVVVRDGEGILRQY